MYKQFEIWWVDLNPTKGAETRKKRPCIILQSDLINQSSRTVLVAPILPHHRDWPFVVNIKPSKKNGLDKDRHINLKQIRAVDISRIDNKQGILEEKFYALILEKIELVFSIYC
ncbi:type II toxin-antitoxin system PemK/MazF family toxin [Kordia sp.]|uniref:type II toxin-antitoxin system PemK/MazF family toxin n=1 Tax=Kordia sp. TaxID=1965332 RepID=UPI003D6A6CA3